MTLIILADDLTGAADSAARSAAAGLPARIMLVPQPVLPSTGVVALTSDSRHLAPDRAAMRVREVVATMPPLSENIWYKKIDSTLRGNIGAELDAMLDVLGYPRAIVCPAFPAQGRGLRDGRLVYAEAHATPPDLVALLRQQSTRPVAAIGVADVRAGVEHLRACLRRLTAPVAVVDGLSDQDLETLALAVSASDDTLMCGSAGLVQAITRVDPRFHPWRQTRSDDDALIPPDGRIVVVVGSGSQMAHRQIDFVRGQPGIAVAEVSTEPFDVSTQDLLLHHPLPDVGVPLDGPEARRRAATLADVALRVIEQVCPAALVVVGGDTAMELLQRLRISHLDVRHEVSPGVALTRADDGRMVVLKSGNHGDDRTLMTILRAVRLPP